MCLVELAGRRDRQHQRLPPGRTAVSQGIPQPAVPALGVQLVEQQAVNVETLGPERIRREHPIERVAGPVNDALPAVDHLEHLAQRWRRADHRRRLAVDDPGLLAVAGRTVDLRTRLAICQEHVQADARQQRALAVLLWDLNVCLAVLPAAVRLEPAEDFTQHVLLPWQERERLPGRLSFGVLQHLLKERIHPLGLGFVDAWPTLTRGR